MTASNFPKALMLVLKSEGGYVDNVHDRGGATMQGVTQRVYDAYRATKAMPRRGVSFISPSEVEDIYRAQYWATIKGDDLPPGVDYATFDAAVNSGNVRAAQWLQKAIPTVPVDGHIGLGTVAAAKGINDRVAVVRRLCGYRTGFLHALTNWKYFGRGWANRMRDVQAAAEAMAQAS